LLTLGRSLTCLVGAPLKRSAPRPKHLSIDGMAA
jgi:hypothetical protein